jgi:hypothetical protein
VQDDAGSPAVTVDGPIRSGPFPVGFSANFAWKTQWYASPSAVSDSTVSPTSPCRMTRRRVLCPVELSIAAVQVPR